MKERQEILKSRILRWSHQTLLITYLLVSFYEALLSCQHYMLNLWLVWLLDHRLTVGKDYFWTQITLSQSIFHTCEVREDSLKCVFCSRNLRRTSGHILNSLGNITFKSMSQYYNCWLCAQYQARSTPPSHLSITFENCSETNLGIDGLMPRCIFFCVKRALEIVYNFIIRLYSVWHWEFSF